MHVFFLISLSLTILYRSGERWKKRRDAISKQIKPSNVQSYAPGLNGVATYFTNYLKSVRDENKRISDICVPLRRLLMESMYACTIFYQQ